MIQWAHKNFQVDITAMLKNVLHVHMNKQIWNFKKNQTIKKDQLKILELKCAISTIFLKIGKFNNRVKMA